MQILKRARNAEMDIIPASESTGNVMEEANRRSAKAGYTSGRTKIQNRGYGDSKLNQWPRDRNGNLIGE